MKTIFVAIILLTLVGLYKTHEGLKKLDETCMMDCVKQGNSYSFCLKVCSVEDMK